MMPGNSALTDSITDRLSHAPVQTSCVDWLAGYDEKRKRFERHALWFLGEGDSCIATAVGPPSGDRF